MNNPDALLTEAIRRIRERPQMFLVKGSLIELDAFLRGFCLGLDMGRPVEEFPHCSQLRDFQRWLNIRTPGHIHKSWQDLLLTMVANDEEAFERFFVLWEEFLSTQEAT
jgi:hypothetical protein